MNNRDSFSQYHPIVSLVYFIMVIGFSMIFMHPLCLGISLFSAVIYNYILKGSKATSWIYMLPLLLLTALINPAFNHRGLTILLYLPSGNPLTLESLVYGLAAATMIGSVIVWFSSYSKVMTSDKFIYLFGRIIPSFSLVLSMVLSFVPRFKAQAIEVARGQKGLGRDISKGSLLQRLKLGIKIMSILITWSLENAIETGDSMKSRGYGLPGRTAFSIYEFTKRDGYALAWFVACGFFIMLGWFKGVFLFQYFPTFKFTALGLWTSWFFVFYFTLGVSPVLISLRDSLVWRSLGKEGISNE